MEQCIGKDLQGLSPRLAGEPQWKHKNALLSKVYPAPAGEPPVRQRSNPTGNGLSPRLRGNRHNGRPGREIETGLSPRLRGNQSASHHA